jgi:hypothetical protein
MTLFFPGDSTMAKRRDKPVPRPEPTSSEKFTFFWSGPFSQWHPCVFVVEGITFNCAEQFMMYSKAVLFGDMEAAESILASASPRDQKALGRTVAGFDDTRWKLFREGVVYTGSYAKFSQNDELKTLLLETAGTTLVEASPKDRIWGIGLGEEDPRARDRTQWQGLNLLGEILTRVREAIAWEVERTA